MLSKEKVLAEFEKTKGILRGHFVLTSGRHSDTYMQCAKLFEHPETSAKLCEALAHKMKDLKIDSVASPAVGGIIMGYEMARQFGVRNIFAERQDGKMTLRRGFTVEKGERFLVAEDVVTTGGSLTEVIELLQELGAEVVACCSIVDRSNGAVKFPVRYESLLAIEVISHEPADCPLCKEGKTPAYKPGSRNIK